MRQQLESLGGGRRIEIDAVHPIRDGRSGRGVSIGVVDSGVDPWNPHVAPITGVSAFRDDGTPYFDALDRLGHGTAVAAAIQEKAADAELHIIKVFDRTLSTSTRALARAIDWAVDRELRLVNLSIGTVRPHGVSLLADAVKRAHEHGTIIVSARMSDAELWYPGCLPFVVGVVLDCSCPRDTIWIEDNCGLAVFGGSGCARPVPGVPPERNLTGVSFAVANVTGVLACMLEARPEVRSLEAILQLTMAPHLAA